MFTSLLTIFVTLLLGVLGFIVNTLIQRKNNSIEIITKRRLERREKTRTVMQIFIKYSNYEAIKAVVESNMQNQVLLELSHNYGILRSLYTLSFPADIKLCNTAKELFEYIIDCVVNFNNYDREAIERKLTDLYRNFEKISDLYISTDWSRIKAETVGKGDSGARDKWLRDYKIKEKYYDKYTSEYRHFEIE